MKIGQFIHVDDSILICDPAVDSQYSITPNIFNMSLNQYTNAELWMPRGLYYCYIEESDYIICLDGFNLDNAIEKQLDNVINAAFSRIVCIRSKGSEKNYNSEFFDKCEINSIQFLASDMFEYLKVNAIPISNNALDFLNTSKGCIYFNETPTELQKYVKNIRNSSSWNYYMENRKDFNNGCLEIQNGICLQANVLDCIISVYADDDGPGAIKLHFCEN